MSAQPETPHALSMSGSLHKGLGRFGDSDVDFIYFHTIHWAVPSVLNIKLPHFLLTIWFVQKVAFLAMALLASNSITSFSPINTIRVQATTYLLFNRTFTFCWYALSCVFAYCKGTIVSIFTASSRAAN